ncbi:hypothetical protein ABGV40_16095 [Paenibacillus amylolyticus]
MDLTEVDLAVRVVPVDTEDLQAEDFTDIASFSGNSLDLSKVQVQIK